MHTNFKSLTPNWNHSHRIQITHTQFKSLAPNSNHSHQIEITHTEFKSLTLNLKYSQRIKISPFDFKLHTKSKIFTPDWNLHTKFKFLHEIESCTPNESQIGQQLSPLAQQRNMAGYASGNLPLTCEFCFETIFPDDIYCSFCGKGLDKEELLINIISGKDTNTMNSCTTLLYGWHRKSHIWIFTMFRSRWIGLEKQNHRHSIWRSCPGVKTDCSIRSLKKFIHHVALLRR